MTLAAIFLALAAALCLWGFNSLINEIDKDK